jgi:hypothetical protein
MPQTGTQKRAGAVKERLISQLNSEKGLFAMVNKARQN